ncbi:MAG: Bro-N domain-containing protein [Candidatus Woesearchaeota archaeon]
MTGSDKALVVFEGKKIRRVWYKERWWFSVVDIVGILSESEAPRNYWKVLKHRLTQEGANETVTNCNQLKLLAEDGKLRETDCATTKNMFRIIQSIPSPKAEPLKLWLAQVGYERIQEIQDPELAQKRMKELYQAKGYSDDWIEKRVRGIAIRDELTDEWKKREVKTKKEYAILTAEISKATFGMTPSEYKKFKGLKKENLRDHMDDLELIFTMLGEASTTKIARKKDAKGFIENKEAAKEGGIVAGVARKELEQRSGEKVSVRENYFFVPEKRKKLEDLKKK